MGKQNQVGKETEKSVSSIFRQGGYWVYNCPKSSSGSQPFDLIAIKGSKENPQLCLVWLIDGKHVRENEVSFKLERIEPNQWASMRYASDFANINVDFIGFVIRFERTGEFYWLPYENALELVKENKKSVNLSDLSTLEEAIVCTR